MDEDQKSWSQLELEYRRLKNDPDVIHNKVLHQHILETWKRDSPRMWAKLQKHPGRANSLAFVLQQRMWAREEELLRAGFPVTDAREQAEAENLMLEPEQPLPKPEDEYDRLRKFVANLD
jgi:hypothetical protein